MRFAHNTCTSPTPLRSTPMKYCPLCESVFEDTDWYCELDGTQLDELENADQPEVSKAKTGENWVILSIVAFGAVLITFILVTFALQRLKSGGVEQSSARPSAKYVVAEQPVSLSPPLAAPSETPSPSPEASPSPSVTPSPTAQAEAAKVRSDSSPVSTGADENGKSRRIVIQLTNGTDIEVDNAWETGEGIWYRSGGVITLLARERVKAIKTKNKNAAVQEKESTSPETTQPANASSPPTPPSR